MILTALSAAWLMFAVPPDTALAYAEALARAERYEDEPAANNWRTTSLGPMLQAAMPPILQACVPETSAAGKPDFTLVLSFKGGGFEAVRHTSDHPMAQCIVGRMATLKYPTPPHPDFAEEIHLKLGGN